MFEAISDRLSRTLGKLRRGARLSEDNVADAFCPVGRLDPMEALALAVVTAHLDPPFGPWLASVTTNARRAIGLDPQPIDRVRTADLLVADAIHTADVVRGARRLPLEEYLSMEGTGVRSAVPHGQLARGEP